MKKEEQNNENEQLRQTPVSGSAEFPKPSAKVKCNCGHFKKDHYRGGFCHSSAHPKAGQCGCTFYYPNDKWILKQKKKLEATTNA